MKWFWQINEMGLANYQIEMKSPWQIPPTYILPGTSLEDVRLELANEDAVQAALGKLPRHKVSSVGFLMIGFELEDSQ